MVFSGREGGEGESVNVQAVQEERQQLPCADLQTQGWEACSVCGATLSSGAAPKLLPCLHVVCRSCVTQNNGGNTKDCQVCGQSFSLSEVTDCFIFEDSAPKCGGCEESALSGWCVQCEEALCSDCVLAHQRVKVTRNHTVIPEVPPSGFTASLHCASHRQERLKFFCLTCDELTCRDCQLINHRGHSFLLLVEALVSQKEQLQGLLNRIREQRSGVKASLLDVDGRLQNIQESKAAAKKKIISLVHNMRSMMLLRGRQLFKEVEGLYKEEEKSLMEMKTTLRCLENRQEHITAFIQKVLGTEGQCILLHKKQIRKRAEVLLSQKTCQCETILHPLLFLNNDLYKMCKTFGSVKASRVPFTSARENKNNINLKEAPNENDCSSGLNFKSVAVPQLLAHSQSNSAPEQSLSKVFVCDSLKPAQPSQVLSDSVLPLAVTSDHVQSKAPSVSCTYAPSVSTLVQAPKSVPAHSRLTLPQSTSSRAVCLLPSQSREVVRSLSHHNPLDSPSQPQSLSAIPDQPVCKNAVWFPPLQGKKKHSMSVQPLSSLPGNVPSTASHLSFTSSMAHHSASLHNATSQYFKPSNTVTTQSPSLTRSLPGSQSVPSLSTLAPPALSGQGVPNPQPNTLSHHTQQSLPLSQYISVPSQALHPHWPPLAVPATGPLSVCQAPPNPQTVILQHGQPVAVPSSPIVFTILKNKNTFHPFSPFPAENQTSVVTYTQQPTVLLTAPVSVPTLAATCIVPNAPTASTSTENEKSLHPVSSKVSCSPLPSLPNISVLPGSGNTVSSKALHHAAQKPCVSNNPDQSEHATQPTQKPQCELPVQAPADSVCERDISTHGRVSPAVEEQDDNLPTSTVSETDTRELQEQCMPLSTSPDLISAVPVPECLPNKKSLGLLKSLLESTSTSEHQSSDTPTSLLQLSQQICAPASNSDDVPTEDALFTSDSEYVSPPNVTDDEDEETDISDSELMKQDNLATKSEKGPELTEAYNKSLCVSLLRLPISFSASGSDLPQFHIVSSGQTDEILLQEIQEGQSGQICFRIPAPPDAVSLSRSSTPDGPQLNDLLDCAVCLSAGATLICAECGRSFHTDCHVPPVLVRPIVVWVCSLCQDVFDDTDPFSCDRLTEPYLNLQDQRRCEQLLLTLMCEEHSYLLYKATKRTARSVEFDFIRGRLLGKQTPPYRSAAELVSDLWALFDILLANSKRRDFVIKLQNSFQERLDVAFSKSLHASLLRPPGSEEQKRAPESELEKDKAKSTLKRMREFLAASSATVSKKLCPEKSTENSPVSQVKED
ncbi:E3 ubiquitin-protein ligase TRIM33 [Pygocentrus nattereri]|uniref:Tripartite motif containing 66 n=1 Tax=Pygocentrus nattereri TaxID=42514 RepID=A0A3B4BRM6_PYGNA|nr:E3 ubiquitin-protein ligase TRIM33 [Pygocentrus nattereri]